MNAIVSVASTTIAVSIIEVKTSEARLSSLLSQPTKKAMQKTKAKHSKKIDIVASLESIPSSIFNRPAFII
jgi:hypothetical protein